MIEKREFFEQRAAAAEIVRDERIEPRHAVRRATPSTESAQDSRSRTRRTHPMAVTLMVGDDFGTTTATTPRRGDE